MNPKLSSAISLLPIGLLAGVLLVFNPWLLFPFMHVRTLLLGFFPFLAFYPIADSWMGKLDRDGNLDTWERLVYSAFLSFGLACATAFLLLTLHVAYPMTIFALSLLLIAVSWGWWRNFIFKFRNSFDRFPKNVARVETMILAIALLLAVSAGILPPLGYDAHEYHLSVPERYLKAGGWFAFPENVYAAFPMNVELLYLWPLAAQSPSGCTAINLLLAGFSAVAVWRLGQRWGLLPDNLLAPIVFLSTGLVLRLILQANIDLALTFSAVILLLAYERYREDSRRVDIVMMTLAFGFAFGSKYISALSIGLPFIVMLLWDFRRIREKQLIVPLLGAMVGGVLLYSPWAIRNAILYHNPFYPLLTPILGGTPAFFADVFQKVHAAQLETGFGAFLDFWFIPLRKLIAESLPVGFSALCLVGIPAVHKLPKNHPLIRTFVFMIAAYFAWFLGTQRNDRFLSTILPGMALLAVYGVESIGMNRVREIARGMMLLIVGMQLYGAATVIFTGTSVEYLLHPTLDEFYLAEQLPHYRSIQWLNGEMEKPGAARRIGKVLFIGEAQTYGAHFEAVAPTVFNHHPLENGLDPSYTHILYNASELKRLREGYGPYGWPLGEVLDRWMQENSNRLKLVYDAYPEKPGIVAVYEIVK